MKAILYSALVLFLVSCTTGEPLKPVVNAAALSPKPLDFYTVQLANTLFAQLPAQSTLTHRATEIAVASFVPVNSLSLAKVDEAEKQLANQLSESMLSHARQRGFTVYDFRVRQQLLLAGDHEQVLSRQLADLSTGFAADTLLTGTYSTMEDGIMVNVRLISIRNNQVLAAASGSVPANVFWSQQQVTKRGDKLFRQAAEGEQK
jgi:TolB-like protein